MPTNKMKNAVMEQPLSNPNYFVRNPATIGPNNSPTDILELNLNIFLIYLYLQCRGKICTNQVLSRVLV
jgi:hypothetical protein